MRALHALGAAMLVLLGGQIALGWSLRYVLPHRALLPPLPTPRMAAASAFGDRQFFFRRAALDLQEAGDTGGRIVPIGNYDYDVVLGWLRLLQSLDPRSMIPVSLASGIFGASQDLSKVPSVIRFIQEDVAREPERRWKLLYDAIFLADVRLNDRRLALEVARQLSAYGPDIVPQIAALTPAFLLEQDRQPAQALVIVEDVRTRYAGRLTPVEDEWSRDYLAYLRGQGPRPK